MFTVKGSTGYPVTYKKMKFSGGEIHVTLEGDVSYSQSFSILAHLYSSDDIFELLLLVDALRRARSLVPIYLILPYLPYARQDRVCNPGEALSLRVFCDLINSMKFRSVEVWDVHSDVSLALLDRVENVSSLKWLKCIDGLRENSYVLVAPDAGSIKKVYQLSQELRLPFITARKIRDIRTGEIIETKVDAEPMHSKNFLIVDDICDGGRTFIELSRRLKVLSTRCIDLYVTHGIFSKGLGVFDGRIDRIYCPHVWPNVSNVTGSTILRRL